MLSKSTTRIKPNNLEQFIQPRQKEMSNGKPSRDRQVDDAYRMSPGINVPLRDNYLNDGYRHPAIRLPISPVPENHKNTGKSSIPKINLDTNKIMEELKQTEAISEKSEGPSRGWGNQNQQKSAFAPAATEMMPTVKHHSGKHK